MVAISACLLASPAASRQPPLESESAAAPGDGSKITLVFCLIGEGNYFGHGWQDCYCCGDVNRDQSCHPTMEECRAQCPLCNPRCSQLPALAATANATSYN